LELKFKGKKRDDPEMMDQPDTGRHWEERDGEKSNRKDCK
jgi:hypothetical protein